jgi:hypothetical protein
MERKNHLQDWLQLNAKQLQDWETVSLERLIDYLDVVKTPHQGSSSRSILEKDFKRFFSQYDQRRNKNFLDSSLSNYT